MRAATRKQTSSHKAEMAARAERRDLRRRRLLGQRAMQAKARALALELDQRVRAALATTSDDERGN